MSDSTLFRAGSVRPSSSLSRLLVVAVAAGGALAPVATASPKRASHGRVAAHDKSHARPAAGRRGRAARSETTQGPVLHTVGTGHFGAPEGDAFRDESWVEYADVRRGHITIDNLLDPNRSVEHWDSDADWLDVGITGRLTTSVASRLDVATDLFCEEPPAGTNGQWSREAWARELRLNRAAERTQIEQVDAISHDAVARAALPAGPEIGGRSTVVATIPGGPNARGRIVTFPVTYLYDAHSGAVLRRTDSDGYTDYSTWELTPAGGDAATVALPSEVVNAAHCG